jgi:stage II sporulation protein AA (anti-sigma F factor antagonist)
MQTRECFELEETHLGERPGSMLRVRGDVTHREAPRLRRGLLDAIEKAHGAPLVVDLAAVHKMDTSGVAVLVEGLGRSLEDGGNVLLCAPSESVRRVFELAGLEEALNRCFSCMEELWPRLPSGHDKGRQKASGARA